MGKILLICGRLCSGKSYYSAQLAEQRGAVILSCDELMIELFTRDAGDAHDLYLPRVKQYLLKKAAEIVRGQDVILDWGFWRKSDRAEIAAHFAALGIPCEWHCISIDDETWYRRIAERNEKVLRGETADYYVDDGLLAKFDSMFEEPSPNEMDIIVF